jgi:deazaflavin-dependent oxidoreductase (nitroreductase family)
VNFFQQEIDEYRATAGSDGLALLTTTGARTGRSHTVPVGYVPDGDRLLLVASAGGAPRHPGWFHNVVANPRVTIETGDGERITTRTAIAVPAAGPERDRLFAAVVAVAPGYADYQRRTERVLPVVVLHPEDPDVLRVRAAGDELIAIHGWFREAVDGLAPALAEGTPIDAAAFAEDLRDRCLAFCSGLHNHHAGEDIVIFSFLQQRFPELASVLEDLRAEHARVSELRSELLELLSGPEPATATAEFDRLAAALTAHLDREERLLVPILNALPDVPWPKFG